MTGYSANTSGGSDITTIKYGFTDRILKQTNGNMLLQFSGTPGLSYGFQGTTNFEFWDELGSSEADTNGIIEFLDTNAPLFSHRFYRWHYP